MSERLDEQACPKGRDLEDRASFVLSAFGDEIDDDVDTQLDCLADLDIRYLEMRTAWGKKAADLDDREIERLTTACRKRSIGVSCIGSRIGKSPITEPLEATLAELGRILDLAERLDTKLVRIFSFRPPAGREAEHVDESLARLKALAEVAGARGVVLVMENETGTVGDIPERCRTLLQGAQRRQLRRERRTARRGAPGVPPAQPSPAGGRLHGGRRLHRRVGTSERTRQEAGE